MNTHAVPSGGFPWDTPGGRFGQFFPDRREDLYLLVALRVVGGGGTAAPVTRAFQNPGCSAESGIYPDISGYIRWNLLAIQCESKTEDYAGTLTSSSAAVPTASQPHLTALRLHFSDHRIFGSFARQACRCRHM